MMRKRLANAAAVAALVLTAQAGSLRAAAEAPVASAAMREDLAEVRALLTRGADANAAQGDGMTALHWAAERGNAELTTVLLGAGARVPPRRGSVAIRRSIWRRGAATTRPRWP